MFGFNKRSEEPENLYEEPPVPEIKPCPICNKRPTLVEIVGKGMVYDCGCDCVSISSPSLNPIEVKKDWLREAARRADYLRRLRSCTDVLSRN